MAEPVPAVEQPQPTSAARAEDVEGPPAASGYSDDERRMIEKLNKISKNVRTCMLTTVAEDGSLHARPMSTASVEFGGGRGSEFWFMTKRDSAKLKEMSRSNNQMCLVFQDDHKSEWASVSAVGEEVVDVAKAKAMWHAQYDAWFPGGAEDPSLVLIKAVPHKATYWDANIGNFLNIMFAAARAKFTGKGIAKGAEGDTQTINF